MTATAKLLTKRQGYEVLRAQLDTEFNTFKAQYQDLADNILPQRLRLTTNLAGKGDRRNQKIVDGTATYAVRTLRSGMMGGMSSPARPWFDLTTADPDLAEYAPVKEWLYLVTQRLSTVFLQSNLYNNLPTTYGDLGVFGTSALLLEEDFEDVIRTYSFPVGSYRIAKDARGRVNVFCRVFTMTIDQMVMKFGRQDGQTGKADWSNFSGYIKQQFDQGQTQTKIEIVHIIKPNDDYDPNSPRATSKRFSSCYYELGSAGGQAGANYLQNGDEDKYLRESGYDYFPVRVPRWEVAGEDVYATSCPGMDAIGDIKQLQLMQKRKAEAIEKFVRPPMTGSADIMKASILPGDFTATDGTAGFKPAFQVDPRIQELLLDIQDLRGNIKTAFYTDILLMMSQSDRREITAREIDERREEKLLAFGPVLEQLNEDLYDPTIQDTFKMMVAQSDFRTGRGPVPPPPKELAGQKMGVKYVSIMAQAQKAIGLAGVKEFAGFFVELWTGTQDPAVRRKVNSEQLVEKFGDIISLPPGIVRTDEEVQQMVQAEQAQAQAQAQAEAAAQAAKSAKDLAGADMSGDNALTRLVKAGQAGQLTPTQ